MRALAPTGPRLTEAPARFTTILGQPKTIALKFPTGKPVKSPRSGDIDIMYTLVSGEKAYFPQHVADVIDSLGLAPGEPFTVCNYGRNGWDIERAETARQAPPFTVSAPATEQKAEAGRLTAPAPANNPTSFTNHTSAPHAPAAVSAMMMNGAGEDTAAILARCYASAIAVTIAMLEAARAQGLHFAPTHEGLQAAAATLFIAETRRQS